jgi:hypothetical protein
MSTYGPPVATNQQYPNQGYPQQQQQQQQYPQQQYQNQHQAGPGRAAGPAERPVTLTAGVGAALGVVLLNIIAAIMMIASVTDMVKEQIAGSPDFGEEAVTPDMVDMTSDRAQGLETIFSSLAYNTIFWMLVLTPLVIFAARGGKATRIISAIILAVTVLYSGVFFLLPVGAVTMLLSGLVSLLAIAAIVLFFLPASNEYGRLRRASR